MSQTNQHYDGDTARKFLEAITLGTDKVQLPLYLHRWMLSPTTEKGACAFYKVDDLGGFLGDLRMLSGKQHVYVGMGFRGRDLGKFKRGGASDIVAIPGLWAEIDVLHHTHAEKNLPRTKEEAVALLTGLLPEQPPTMLVDSGGGVYGYWLFDQPWVFTGRENRELAQGMNNAVFNRLATAAKANGWEVDNVGDLPRILRLPGTANIKDPANIRMTTIMELHEDRRYPRESLSILLAEATAKPERTSAKETKVAKGADFFDEEPSADAQRIVEGCAFMRHCREDAESLTEPEWYAMITVLSRCEGGEELVHEWSRPYSGYSEQATAGKIEHALSDAPGPHTCDRIAQINGGFCGECRYRGRVKSPIVLGRNNQSPHQEVVEDLNEEFFVTVVGGKCVVGRMEDDPIFRRPVIQLMSFGDFRNLLSNKYKVTWSQEGRKTILHSKLWLDSPNRRQYEGGIVFDPTRNQDSARYLNLYQGLGCEPRPGNWSLMREHILQVICNGDEVINDYLLAWMARIVQDPGGKRPGVCIVLRGGQGAGKGLFATNFGKLFTPHFLHITQQGQLTGRFNSHLASCLFCFVDEGIWAGDKAAEGVLKGLITEDTIMVEHKGKDAFQVANHVNIMMASNNQWVVPAGLDERRFLVLDVANVRQQDHEYFRALVEQMDNGGREAMLHDLLNLDISGVNLREVPKTAALLDQIQQSMSPVARYWFERLKSGSVRDELVQLEDDHRQVEMRGTPGYEWGKPVPTTLIYRDFLEFAKRLGLRRLPADSQFAKELRQYCPNLAKVKVGTGAERANGLCFPPLEECRQDFASRMRVDVEWDDDLPEVSMPRPEDREDQGVTGVTHGLVI